MPAGENRVETYEAPDGDGDTALGVDPSAIRNAIDDGVAKKTT